MNRAVELCERGGINIVCAPKGAGKTSLMRGFCNELTLKGRIADFVDANQLRADRLSALASGEDGWTREKRDVIVVDNCFSPPNSYAMWVASRIHQDSPETIMFFLYDGKEELAKTLFSPFFEKARYFSFSVPDDETIRDFQSSWLRERKYPKPSDPPEDDVPLKPKDIITIDNNTFSVLDEFAFEGERYIILRPADTEEPDPLPAFVRYYTSGVNQEFEEVLDVDLQMELLR